KVVPHLVSDAIAQRTALPVLRILFHQGVVLDDLAHEALYDFRHRAIFLRTFRQQPGIERTPFDPDPTRENIACQVQTPHGIAKEDLLRNGHAHTPGYIRKAYILVLPATPEQKYLRVSPYINNAAQATHPD